MKAEHALSEIDETIYSGVRKSSPIKTHINKKQTSNDPPPLYTPLEKSRLND